MKGQTVIIFNDVIVATTDHIISYERETESQKEYRLTNRTNELTASFFCDYAEIVSNDNINVEIL